MHFVLVNLIAIKAWRTGVKREERHWWGKSGSKKNRKVNSQDTESPSIPLPSVVVAAVWFIPQFPIANQTDTSGSKDSQMIFFKASSFAADWTSFLAEVQRCSLGW